MRRPRAIALGAVLTAAWLFPLAAARADDPVRWERRVLTDKYYCDGVTVGDINRDGRPDVVAGPFWYAGPDFKTPHAFYPPKPLDPAASPSDSMFSYVHDFNGDGWPDVLVLGRVHLHSAYWYENPGKGVEAAGHWKKHFAFERVRGESPPFADVDGDGKPELVAHWDNRWGFIRPDWANPTKPWTFTSITPAGKYDQFYHGTGIGDVNGDGRPDLMLNEGWWEQPAAAGKEWTLHPFQFGGRGGAQMFAHDVNGDGRNDVVTALDAHGWGLAWFEQLRDGFRKHPIMGDRSELAKYGVAFTQPHALAAADIDGDGLTDIVVGKRRWAHGPKGDIEPEAAPVVYWFRLVRNADGVRYVPHLIDDASGVGTQITVADVTGDGRPDVLTASKLGVFLFVNHGPIEPPQQGGPLVIDARLHHLRSGAQREWSDFPVEAEGPRLTATFRAKANASEQTLRLRQQDVKQAWAVRLNGKELGRLDADENDTEIVLAVPAGRLADGENTLVIETAARVPDDIRVGEITLDDRPVKDVLAEATVEVRVCEAGVPVPCRVTVLSARGALATTGATSTDRLAVRPGVIYAADGTARFGLPAGDYTIVAGRGFEYGTDTVRVSLKPGDVVRKELAIRREVPTPGLVACDTHVHTRTHSGHGDATDVERAVTAAGEGLELLIATDHNVQVDYHAAAVRAGVRKHFTPVVGNEVTTGVGHFNVFPLPAGGPVPDFKVKDWKGVAAALGAAKGPRAVILNHPRDLHAKFRPFGPERHVALTGESLDGWELPANAVEVVNSGAQQSDVMRPVRDWLGLLNGGAVLTPVGASDSHDVSRYIVGQGRTYIRCRDDRPGDIDVAEAVTNFVAGRVSVSCGLLAEIVVDGKHGPGDLAPVKGDVVVAVRVLGPRWATADQVELYANGIKVREAVIAGGGKPGEKWVGAWTLPRPGHDVHLVAVATGPGVDGLFWPIGKPYQPTSPVVRKRVIGLTGAVWIDGDGDGKRSSARDYAQRVIGDAGADWRRAVRSLAAYDEAIAAQAAGLLRAGGVSPSDKDVRAAARAAGEQVLRGFDAYAEAWRESQLARQESKP